MDAAIYRPASGAKRAFAVIMRRCNRNIAGILFFTTLLWVLGKERTVLVSPTAGATEPRVFEPVPFALLHNLLLLGLLG
jgi:hypothetical protein